VLGGLAAGFLIYVLGQLQKEVPRADAYAAGATVGAAALLVAGRPVPGTLLPVAAAA